MDKNKNKKQTVFLLFLHYFGYLDDFYPIIGCFFLLLCTKAKKKCKILIIKSNFGIFGAFLRAVNSPDGIMKPTYPGQMCMSIS